MTWPTPRVGQIIRYSYLWRHQAARGAEEGSKDRPCVIVVALAKDEGGTQIVVVPITHTPPTSSAAAIALPVATARRVGLDDAPQWISLTDLNRFTWPGPDLRPLPGRSRDSVVIGELPAKLVHILIDRLQAALRAGQAKVTERDE